ncbi:MAG: alanine--tRNA ligase [Patescibacteria group bacterium]|jgi:alanyl-tRNA synthetase
MTANEIREKYLDFFRQRGHAVIPSASLIPENDPTVLFTTAGMHPLVPYLLGEPHPMGKRLTDAQKCIRTGDIDEVGDNRHLTFFEMLGNWSLGDYFKKEAIAWSFEFLTGSDWLKLDPQRLYVSFFEGDAVAPRDDESAEIWCQQFATAGIDARIGERIFAYPKAKNWWGPAGQTGPCGPDTEMFYDTLNLADPKEHALGWASKEPCHPNCDCGRYVEIWNDVFMQFNKNAEGKFEPLAKPNVDTGMGLERTTMILQSVPTVFDTEMFQPLFAEIESRCGKKYGSDAETTRMMRIIADHAKAATFIIGDPRGVGPSNVDQGYIVRRLIRRAVRFGRSLGIEGYFVTDLARKVIELYAGAYSELATNSDRVIQELSAEEEKFSHTLQRGAEEVTRLMVRHNLKNMGSPGVQSTSITGKEAFYLYESFGFPKEITEEIIGDKIDQNEWDAEMKKHQDLSRAGAEQKFSGGLADHSEDVVRLHTATHMLHAALRQVLGDHVEQRGSNITAERLRFDFSHPQKLTPDELKKVEAIVNEKIAADLPVTFAMMTVDEAKAAGSIGLFEDKYSKLGNKVKVYTVGDDAHGVYSREICGGPHAERTSQLVSFKILKEEASSAGIRRIKAVVGQAA